MFSPITITLLIMDVTIGHIYNVHYSYKSANLREVKGSKLQKYQALNIINSNVMHLPEWWQILYVNVAQIVLNSCLKLLHDPLT